MQKTKIGFFGGSFNPPINTHLSIAQYLIKNKILDKVIFVPVGNYYSKKNLIDAKHRYNMIKLLCDEKIQVENIASNSSKNLYAYDTFGLIYKKYGEENDIYFIMGSDNFEKMPEWKNYSEIIKKYNFIVIQRNNNKIAENLQNIKYFEIQGINDITSTRIRKMILKGENVSEYMNYKVIEYINKNCLYNK